ncbi:response regulator [soil metagenome]
MSPRVMVVDDDDTIREIAQLSLSAVGGWDTVTARSGEEALSKVSTERLDAILLDVMMPGLDGPGTVSRLQADPATSGLPVIILTAKARVGDQDRFRTLPGVVGVIAKPFDPMTLPGQVSVMLGWT